MLLDGTWPVVNLLNGMHLRENEQHNKGSTSDDSRADISACDGGSTHHHPPVLVAHPECKKGLELETTNSEHQTQLFMIIVVPTRKYILPPTNLIAAAIIAPMFVDLGISYGATNSIIRRPACTS